MYLPNKYTKCYYSIINRAKERVLGIQRIEKHHIIPKSFGGSDEVTNIALLTLREHFICHLLLPKMTAGKQRTKMIYALWMMCRASKTRREAYKCTSKTYEQVKQMMVNSRTSADFTPEWKERIAASKRGKPPWNKGITRTEAERNKMSETRKKLAVNGLKPWNVGIARTDIEKTKIKEANTGKQWVYNPNNPSERKQLDPEDTGPYLNIGWILGLGERKILDTCPHCQRSMDVANLKKWHGDKCKYRQ